MFVLRRRSIWTTLRFAGLFGMLTMAAFIAMASGRLPVSVQAGPGGPVVSLDAVPDAGNTASTVGSIQNSRTTTCGSTFNVDVVIQGVTDIAGFQANLLYNPATLRVKAVNYNFLLSTTGAAVLDLGNSTPDTDGDFLLFAAMYSITPIIGASGNGVLARISLEAVGSGSSALDLTSVKMVDANANFIPPTDANGFYVGPVNDASIVVNPPCGQTATPTATQMPPPPGGVGGIAELPDLALTTLEAGDSSGSSASFIGAGAAAAMAVALVLGGAAWYARKRGLR
jgi:hypothetical protein